MNTKHCCFHFVAATDMAAVGGGAGGGGGVHGVPEEGPLPHPL